MNNKLISNTNVNKLYVAHSIKKQKLSQDTSKNYIEAAKPVKKTIEPHFYSGKSFSYDSNGGGYQGL